MATNFAVTSQDLIDGMVRSSGTARAMGISFRENIAILTALREASGRTGKQPCPMCGKPHIANAVNSGEAQRWVILSEAA